MNFKIVFDYSVDALIIYLIGALISLSLIIVVVHFSKSLPDEYEREVRANVTKITGKPVGNLCNLLNSISWWLYIYVAFSWPKAIYRIAKSKLS